MSLATASLIMEMRIHHSGRKCAKNDLEGEISAQLKYLKEQENVDRDQINIFICAPFPGNAPIFAGTE